MLVLAVSVALMTAVLPPLVDAHEGPYPIVLVHGWTGSSDSWREMLPQLEAQGLTVLDFDTSTAGTQALSYGPTGSGQHIPFLANLAEDKIQQALIDNGYSASQKVDIVAHSMGGLVARFLVEQPGADVDHYSESSGWYGDGVADIRTDWAERVDDLIMLGTPNHGTWEAWVPATVGGFGDWNPSGGDMRPGSTFLDAMGYSEPAGETYHAVGGDPAYLNFLQYDYDGDGVSHGFDGVVPAESPYLSGATMDFTDDHHFGLRTSNAAIDLVIELLGQTSQVDGVGDANIAGDAVVRLEYLEVVNDHDSGSAGEYLIDVYVDPDGTVGSSGYQLVDTIEHTIDGPFTTNWGDDGPTAAAINVPGDAPSVSVKMVVKEDDTSWGGGYEAVSTHYFVDAMLSEDIDGLDYYEDQAADAEGGTNTLRLSLNGVTADIEHTRQVELGFDRSYIKDDHDWGEGEVTFDLNAGRLAFTSAVDRGDIEGDHFGRDSGEWVDIGSHAMDGGAVEPETIWNGRMLEDATLRFDVTYWEDDGGWSAADGGNMYYLETSLTNIGEGRTDYAGSSLPDYNAYIYVVKTDDAGVASMSEPRELDAVLNPLSLVPNGPDDPPDGPLDPTA